MSPTFTIKAPAVPTTITTLSSASQQRPSYFVPTPSSLHLLTRYWISKDPFTSDGLCLKEPLVLVHIEKGETSIITMLTTSHPFLDTIRIGWRDGGVPASTTKERRKG